MSTTIHMKAPKNIRGDAFILGQRYSIPADGIVRVASEDHVETFRLFGFTDHYVEPEDLGAVIEAMTDRQELVTFIEERGGEADVSMTVKKLKRIAREVAEVED